MCAYASAFVRRKFPHIPAFSLDQPCAAGRFNPPIIPHSTLLQDLAHRNSRTASTSRYSAMHALNNAIVRPRYKDSSWLPTISPRCGRPLLPTQCLRGLVLQRPTGAFTLRHRRRMRKPLPRRAPDPKQHQTHAVMVRIQGLDKLV